VKHLKEYRRSDADGSEVVLEPTEEPVKSIIFYRALVKVVELYVDGRMFQGDASTLAKGGWTFKIDEGERIRAISSAIVVENQLLSTLKEGSGSGMSYEKEKDGSYCLRDVRSKEMRDTHGLGLSLDVINAVLARDEEVFSIAQPEELMQAPWHPPKQEVGSETAGPLLKETSAKEVSNSFTYTQRKQMQMKEKEPSQKSLKPQALDPAFAERQRAQVLTHVGVSERKKKAAAEAWMKKLTDGNYEGPILDRSRYLTLRNSTIEGNPRMTEEYRQLCVEAVGVGKVWDPKRYAHLEENDIDPIRWVVARGSGCMWLPDSPRTTVKGFRHRLITKGPPIRGRLFRLNRPDTEWIEKAIEEDVKRGQLVKGNSDWGFPAFPTKQSPDYKAIKRGRRMVVDYRELNKVTVRKFFLIPNSDYIKSTVAGNEFVSVGDLKEGFNQVDNEEETRKKMAVLSAGGCWLPRGLTFGPTNGPEDFQELVFTVFQRRLYKDWFLFVDDLSVATGRKKCHGGGPSGAHDVVERVNDTTEGEKGALGLNVMSGAAFPSPFAHLRFLEELFLFFLVWWFAHLSAYLAHIAHVWRTLSPGQIRGTSLTSVWRTRDPHMESVLAVRSGGGVKHPLGWLLLP